MNCKIGTGEWILLIIVTVILDIVQVILTLLVIGLILNRIIDIIVGLALPAYFWFRGVSMTNWKNMVAMVGGFAIEELGLGGDDGLPFWTLEVVVVWLTTKAEKKIAGMPILGKAMNSMNTVNEATQPLNNDGVRQPQPRPQQLYRDGIRPPAAS